MPRKRGSDKHPARLRSVPDGKAGQERDSEHLRVVSDPPRVLPTLIAGDDDDPDADAWQALEMSLPLDTLIMMQRQGISVQDVLDHKVPGLDPDEIVAKAMAETGSSSRPVDALRLLRTSSASPTSLAGSGDRPLCSVL